MQITGRTSILFILCDPVRHVRGTHLFNQRFEAEGIDAAFSPLHVAPSDLPVVVASLRKMRNVKGFGVTIPHKIAIVPMLDELTDAARLIGSVNFVRREEDGSLVGSNVDGEGFLQGLASRGISGRGRKILQLGAGGAGRAVAFATALDGAAQLTIWNRTAERGAQLASEVQAAAPGCVVSSTLDSSPKGYDVVINTTSAGMKGSDLAMACDVTQISAGTDIADIVIVPEETPLIAAARAKGLRVSIGSDMLLGQYRLMKEFVGLQNSTEMGPSEGERRDA